MEISRNQQHYIIMTVIYNELTDFNFGEGQIFRDARELTASLCECDYEEVPDFIKNTIAMTLKNYGKIVEAIKPFLREDWKWERIPLLTQAILLMSYAHFYYVEKVDKRIIINVAVDLAKKYFDVEQAKFINGVLNGVIK